VVVAGLKDQLDGFIAHVKEAGGRAMPLKVGGAFHSPFMVGASSAFEEVLETIDIKSPEKTLYSNLTAKPYDEKIKELLAKQICNPVMWRICVENMIKDGADTFIEVGPGKTLAGLVSRISSEVRVFNVEDIDSLNKTVEELKNKS